LGLVLTGIGLIHAGLQLPDSKRIVLGDFLLRLDNMFKQQNEIHKTPGEPQVANERERRFDNGMVFEDPAPARLDCHYLISAWSPMDGKTLSSFSTHWKRFV
jgi:hypothetical protein